MGYEEFYLVIADDVGKVVFYWGNYKGELSHPHWCNMCLPESDISESYVWWSPDLANEEGGMIVKRTILPCNCKSEIRSFRH